MLQSRLLDKDFCNVFGILAPDYNIANITGQNVIRRRKKSSE
jgi:hypothetical protein